MWLVDAQREHTSIATLSRHLHQLRVLGAPADLIDGTKQAILDEFEHAKLCVWLACTYDHETDIPTPLAPAERRSNYELLTVVSEVILQGCISKTITAMTADHAALHAIIPNARAALSKIASDELRHSLLAWSFVRWAHKQDPRGVGHLIELTINTLSKPAPRAQAQAQPDHLAHGRLGSVRRRQIRHAAINELVLPMLCKLRSAKPRLDDASPSIA